MDDQLISDISLAVARGDLALWLGSTWDSAAASVEAEQIAAVDWLGVWSEALDARFGAASGIGSCTPSGRLIVEVPDQIEDVLGEHFSIADVCPHFYLNGRRGRSETLSAHQRRKSRDRKVDKLGVLKTSMLVVAGYNDAESLIAHLEEISEAAPECRLFLLTDVSDGLRDKVVDRLPERTAARVASCEQRLDRLLADAQSRRAAVPEAPSVRVGKTSIRLDRLLRTEPPIDQDFTIVTEQDIRDPEATEDDAQLLRQLLGGTDPPWRAIAHRHDWQRVLPHRREAAKWLNKMRQGRPCVKCLNFPAEPGAGLTTLLHQIAFDAARDGAPVLIHKPHGELDYDRLRTFLTDLNALLVDRGAANEPSVIVFDSDSVRADSTGQLRTIAARMSRDGRRVLLIRGIPVSTAGSFNADFKKLYECRRQGETVEEDWMDPIPASLNDDQQESLLRWAEDRLKRIGQPLPMTARPLVHSWESQVGAGTPLLIFLYSVLTGELREAAALGRHLISHLLAYIREDNIETAAAQPVDNEPLAGDRLQVAVAQLAAAWGRMPVAVEPTANDVAAVFVALAAMGCLRLGVSRNILAAITSVGPSNVVDVVRRLERWNLATTGIASATADTARRQLFAPSAFYTREESVGLLHPSYGRLVLEWLLRSEAAEARRLLGASGVTEKFFRAVNADELEDTVPIRLLQPVFAALTPSFTHVRFAEDVAMRYLRLQKGKQQEEFARRQWERRELVLEAFEWLAEQVVQESASLLHSRGISTYKSCGQGLSLESARERYQAAEKDFHRGISLAREGGSEQPAHIMSSLGLLYLGWLERERLAENCEQAAELDRKVERTLRDAIAETAEENPYAVFGLAKYLVSRYERSLPTESTASAAYLAEAIELLQIQPESYFEDDWNELKRSAIAFLDDAAARDIIEQLKRERNELGYVLDALRVTKGSIPSMPTTEPHEVNAYRNAAQVLRGAETVDLKKRSHLADLLRYALFSADPDRLKEPSYRERHNLISRLVGSRYLDTPLWLFDYAMLCFQIGQYGEGADAYAKLRKGKRYFDVSRDRSCWLSEGVDTLKPARLSLRIISVESPDGKAWGRIEQPRRFRDPVPLSARSFRSRGKTIQAGHTVVCHISLNPAGPFAEPIGVREA